MNKDKINEIIEGNDIIDVISSYIPLKKTGSNFKASCPFHDEKTASFVASPQKQIFKCFGCGESGNSVSFVMKYEKISFIEAMKKLAKRANIEIPIKSNFKNSENDFIYNSYKLAHHFFQKNIMDFGSQAVNYFKQRDITLETIKKYEIGFALNSFSALKNHLIKNKMPKNIIDVSGLIKVKDDKSYDTFRNRIMFPIHSNTGKVVAFGGRTIETDFKGGKYINSPTTKIYTKGDQLYGLYFTKYDVSKKDYIILTEGYMDFLRMVESGFDNSVAVLGTSLTQKQISLASRFSKNFYLLFDGDKAGAKAAYRSGKLILQNGYNPQIILLPEGEDPDTFLVKNGTDEMQKLIDSPLNFVDFVYKNKSLGFDDKKKLDSLIEVTNNISDSIKRALIIKEIAEVFSISENAIFPKLIQKRGPKKNIQKSGEMQSKLCREEKFLIIYFLNNPDELNFIVKDFNEDYIISEMFLKIYTKLKEVIINHNITVPTEILNYINNEKLHRFLSSLMFEEFNYSFTEIYSELIIRRLDQKIIHLNKQIDTYKDNDKMFNELLAKKMEIHKKKMKLLKKNKTKLIDIRGF